MTAPTTLSAILPVHARVDPEHLAAALRSLGAQDRPADEIIIVEDGPLPAGLATVIDRFSAANPACRRLRLPRNEGAGPARQCGLEAATGDWVALVDSDDVCLPARFATQLAVLARGGVDLIGAAMFEFERTPDNVVGVRGMPTDAAAIRRYARLRMPVNNPTIMFRRDLALAVGGWQALPLNEDYDFVARIIAAGGMLANLAEPLVLFRSGQEVYRRRNARATRRAEVQLQANLRRYGIVGGGRSRVHLLVRLAYRLAPVVALKSIYPRLYLRPATDARGPASVGHAR